MSPARAATFYLRSFGCQMNDHDSERIAGMLQEMGMSRCEAPEDAGVLVYNTCSIREKADSRLAGHLGLAARLKREDPGTDGGRGRLPAAEPARRPAARVSVRGRPGGSAEPARATCPASTRGLRTCRPVGAFQEQTTRWSADLPRERAQGPCAGCRSPLAAPTSARTASCRMFAGRRPRALRPTS